MDNKKLKYFLMKASLPDESEVCFYALIKDFLISILSMVI